MSRAGLFPFSWPIGPLTGKYIVAGSAAATQPWVSTWAANALCQHYPKDHNNQHTRACGVCLGCRCFAEGHHPDYLALFPEAPAGRISIEQVRMAIQFLSITPQQAAFRVLIIWGADSLTVAAANAFLKTLEEPLAESVSIILVTAHPGLLLDTVKSRCFQVRLPTPVDDSTGKIEAYIWTEKDRQLLRICQEAWETPARLCKSVDLLLKSADLREVLYSLLKMGYIIAGATVEETFAGCVGLSSRERAFLGSIAQKWNMNVWTWIDRVYDGIESVQQGISLNATLLIESLFVSRYLLGKQGRQALDGNSIVSYD